MRRHRPVIAFLVASPFEILDLTGPASVFERSTTNGERYYSIQILSTQSGGTVKTAGGMTISNACKYSDYQDRSTPSLRLEDKGPSPSSHRNCPNGCESALRTFGASRQFVPGRLSLPARGCSMGAAWLRIGNGAILSWAAISVSRWNVIHLHQR